MTMKIANLLGLNYVYIILATEVDGHDMTIVDPVFTKQKEAEVFAKKYEVEHNYKVYTDIYRMEVR